MQRVHWGPHPALRAAIAAADDHAVAVLPPTEAAILGTPLLREELAIAAGRERSFADSLTIVAFPFMMGTTAFTIAAGFVSPEQATIWFAVAFVVSLILMRRVDGREALRRLANLIAPEERDEC